MRALAIESPGVARVVDRPEPVAGTGEVVVRVARVGLCGTDLSSFLGKNPLVSYPRVIGHEVAGVIESVGPGVTGWAVGTPVAVSPYKNCGACPACRANRPNACRNNQTLGVQREGALAERAVVAASRLHTSASLSVDQLALVEPFSVGMHAVARARVEAKDDVLVIGCGGVGVGAVAGAAGRGARVIAFDVSEAKRTQALRLGAADAVDALATDAADQIAALTGGDGPSVVIEAVGSPTTYRLALDVVASCGRIACLGWVKGDVALEARHLVAKEVDLVGSRNALHEFGEVISLFESGRVDPLQVVTDRVPIEEVPGVLERWAADPAGIGKVLVSVRD
jgi:threonine dehydrogenase-like Zn-dependent dehydrogenase